MHWRQEIKREILLSQGQKGVSSSLRENSLTKGKASWFGWVSPEQRTWERWFLQGNIISLLAQQVHIWPPPCPMAEAGGSAAAVTPGVVLTTAAAPGARNWSCWAAVVYPSCPALLGLLFPLITLFWLFFLESLLPFTCTIYVYFNLLQKCLFSPKPFSRTLWTRSKRIDWLRTKQEGLIFLPLISSWDYLLLLKIQRSPCLLWGCV